MKNLLLLCTVILALNVGITLAQTGPWIITTDFEVFGQLESIQPQSPWTVSGALTTTPSDAVGRHHNGLVYLVGRGGSNLIRIHDPANDFALIREFSIGAGRNPQDIVFDRWGRAFVSCYDEAVLLQVDTETGTVVQTFSTADYADNDGLPETAWCLIDDDKLYVTCQNLDRGNWYAPVRTGRLLVMDLATLQWLPAIDLVGEDPYTRIYPDGQGNLLVGCVGYWTLYDGGIELVNPETAQSEGNVITEEQLGGDVLSFVPSGDGFLHVLTADSSFATRISRVQLSSETVTPIVGTSGYDLADLFFDGEFQIFVADRQAAGPGIRVFDADIGVELTSGVISTTLPPYSFVMPDTDDLAATPWTGLPAGSLELGLPSPNPCNPRSELVLMDRPDQAVRVSVFDLRGRRVQGTTVTTDSGGRGVFVFEGKDQTGSDLAAGMYRVVAQSQGGYSARSLTLVK